MVANPLTEHFNNLARWLSGGENCTKCTWTEQWLHVATSLSKSLQTATAQPTQKLAADATYQIKENLLNKLNACIKTSRLTMGGETHLREDDSLCLHQEHKNSCDMWLFLFWYVYEEIFVWRSHTAFAVFLHRVHKNVLSNLSVVIRDETRNRCLNVH